MIDVSILIAAGGLILAAATFVVGRLTAATGKGREDGAVLTRLDAIDDKLKSIEDIKDQLGEQRDRLTRVETMMVMYHGGSNHE